MPPNSPGSDPSTLEQQGERKDISSNVGFPSAADSSSVERNVVLRSEITSRETEASVSVAARPADSPPDEDISTEDMNRLSKYLHLNRMMGYKCGECGMNKIENKDGIDIPHLCPALATRVKGFALKGGRTIAHERVVEILERAQRMLDEDSATNADAPPSPPNKPAATRTAGQRKKERGSYKCGKCGAPKKGHICPFANSKKKSSSSSQKPKTVSSPTPDDDNPREAAAKAPSTQLLVWQSSHVDLQQTAVPNSQVPDSQVAATSLIQWSPQENTAGTHDDRKPTAQSYPPLARPQDHSILAARQHGHAAVSIESPGQAIADTTWVGKHDRDEPDDSPTEARPLKRPKTTDELPESDPVTFSEPEVGEAPATVSSQQQDETQHDAVSESMKDSDTSLWLEASTSLVIASPSQDDHLESRTPRDRSPEHDEEDDDIEPETGSNPSPL